MMSGTVVSGGVVALLMNGVGNKHLYWGGQREAASVSGGGGSLPTHTHSFSLDSLLSPLFSASLCWSIVLCRTRYRLPLDRFYSKLPPPSHQSMSLFGLSHFLHCFVLYSVLCGSLHFISSCRRNYNAPLKYHANVLIGGGKKRRGLQFVSSKLSSEEVNRSFRLLFFSCGVGAKCWCHYP